jgi:hypothetical protein
MSTPLPEAPARTPYVTDIYRESVLQNPVKPGEEIFGFFKRSPKAQQEPITLNIETTEKYEVIDGQSLRRRSSMFKGVVTEQLVGDLATLASRQEMKLFDMIRSVLKSETAFESISRKEFCGAMVEAIQQPICAGYYAFNAMGRKFADIRQTTPDSALDNDFHRVGGRMAEILSLAPRSGFLLSGEEFRTGAFAAAPFTVEEIKAVPFLMGVVDDLYTTAGLDYSAHVKSAAGKLVSAGLKTEANWMYDVDVERHLKADSKPARRVHDNDGPSL